MLTAASINQVSTTDSPHSPMFTIHRLPKQCVVCTVPALPHFHLTPVGGAKQVGIVQSLLPTCRLHDINPYDYLVDVLQRVGQHPSPTSSELTQRRRKQR
ncbi:protein of unknown function [Acidithiobacillus ferrivorans]|uniref:Transposase IS66 C-terminal domain-containing protein n=1 Tax=Acidithiobacillus ferrivorans TaxID=160808 RepID=A0A060UNJ6_9PROT|nr:hypothetical protein AFERRI_400003 [Acidithiobacillus ferrivorans]SMH64248.1 protein of unknown function [Acidithiobacillus ferrivorans]